MIIKEHTRNQKRMYRIHKMEEQIEKDKYIIGTQQQEIDRLNNIINRARRKLGEYKYYLTPTEEQNKENEDISEEAYQILHENLYEVEELKEVNNEKL